MTSKQDQIDTNDTDYQRASRKVRRRRQARKRDGETDRDGGQLDLETAAGTKRLDQWGESDD